MRKHLSSGTYSTLPNNHEWLLEINYLLLVLIAIDTLIVKISYSAPSQEWSFLGMPTMQVSIAVTETYRSLNTFFC